MEPFRRRRAEYEYQNRDTLKGLGRYIFTERPKKAPENDVFSEELLYFL